MNDNQKAHQLELVRKNISEDGFIETFEIGRYEVHLFRYPNGILYINVSSEEEPYLPYIHTNSYGEPLDFAIKVSFYGDCILKEKEITKVIDGLKEAKEVVEILTKKFAGGNENVV